ncbi:dihydroxyacetone kinase subunit L [Metabacillus arenae]|uniref:phosphoenolpyruvate--glycerone phosphotransferase n=1 Tax=Metabacillus arenae TaxID=2771434 RepID=A0A926NFB1_9BACI|nr:dihydroxyacetone kinase subunit L [Metabacillus arenae]MBD1382424.1 dihydroxyacetone kinase subunit L [Metabacillus arenae]
MLNYKEFSFIFNEFATENKTKLNELDGAQGDGDLGMTILYTSQALLKSADSSDNLQQWLEVGGKTVRREAPSTMGILLASSLIAVSKTLNEGQTSLSPNEWVQVQQTMINEIKKRGGAQLGDKTLLDAFIPAVETFSISINNGDSIEEAIKNASQAAKHAADKTAELTSKIGRSSWIQERSQGNIDGGAWACYKVYELLAKSI